MESLWQAIEKLFIVSSEHRRNRLRIRDINDPSSIATIASGFGAGSPFSISAQMMEKHFYILGSTGAGKTNLILNLFEDDLWNRHSVVVVDLRGDLIVRALASCAKLNIDQQLVRLIDLRERDWVLGFNPLAGSGEPFIRALHLLDVIRAESSSWGVQLEESLRNALLLLAANGKSLLDIERVLLEDDFALSLLSSCDDPSVHSFFTRFAQFSKDKKLSWALPIFNKVTPLLATPILRSVLGTTNAIDLEQHLSIKGSVLLVSLAVDELARSGRMLGSLVVSSIARAMFARVNVPEAKRNPVRLYVDEFEAMASEAFEGLIAEGRRFKLSLVLSHQNLAQLTPKLRSVIRNNVGLQGLFSCGYQDATELVRELPSDVERDDLLELEPGELFLVPRGGNLLHLKAKLAKNPLSSADVTLYRNALITRHGVQMALALPTMPQNTSQSTSSCIYSPWTLGGLS